QLLRKHIDIASEIRLFFSSRRRHTRSKRDWSSDVCSSDLSCRAHTRISYGRSQSNGGDVFSTCQTEAIPSSPPNHANNQTFVRYMLVLQLKGSVCSADFRRRYS